MIEILTSGLMNSVQDLGRPLYLDQGIGHGGIMDRQALRLANRLVGNPDGAAGLEIAIFPFRLQFHRPCLFAVTGAAAAAYLDQRPLPPWWAVPAAAGSVLRIDAPEAGARMAIAFAGGLDLPVVLGSRSTDLKSGFGGLEGRALLRGDRLALAAPSQPIPADPLGFGWDPLYFRTDFGGCRGGEAQPIRILPGAEYAAFTEEARKALLSENFVVGAENNRQGMRLSGPVLTTDKRLELHSHGIMPGTIQVPPSGQPVIQLAEANTCGGYPKIGHVAEADLWRLAQAPTGSALRFELVEPEQALADQAADQLKLRRAANLLPLAHRKTSRTE